MDPAAPSRFRLRRYQPSDENAVIELWRRSWQEAYPQLDFSARVDWFREHWRGELLEGTILVAESTEPPGDLHGLVTISPQNGYLDQIVVAPEAQRGGLGRMLMDSAKAVSPGGLYLHVNQDNARALSFYKACGFVIAGEDVNRRSGAPVYMMTWRTDKA